MNLKDSLYQIFSIRWIQHASFWLVFLLLELGRFIDMEPERLPNELLFQLIHQTFIVFIVYFNLRVLIPKFWNTGHYTKYILNIFICEIITIASLTTILYNFREIEIGHHVNFNPWKMIMINTFRLNIFILSSSLFHFVKEWIKLKDENLRFTEKAQEQLEAEISILKEQVNPHFLFNTLNNIYSMSLYDSAKTPEMILKLSQLISYMLYECKDEEVILEKEIQFIRNYIDLESVRVEDIAQISFNISGEDPGHKIPPLLFIPLIENAFKHGISTEKSTSEININLDVSKHKIVLEITNPTDSSASDTENNEHGGLGIENVKKRLELLFPNRYKFNISESKNIFTTHLSLNLL